MKKELEKYYDEFFGTGHFEEHFKKHIIAFADTFIEKHMRAGENSVSQYVGQRAAPCLNCGELVDECACMRNKCIKCGKAIGNITFTVCDDCWDKEHGK